MKTAPGKQRKRPRYEIVADDLIRRIERGEFRVNAPLPPIRELMGHYGFSLATVTRALSILESRGLLRTARGKGVFVEPRRPTAAPALNVTVPFSREEASSPVWSRLRIGVVSSYRHPHAGEMWWSRILRGVDEVVRETGGAAHVRLVMAERQAPADLVARCGNDGVNALINLGDHWSAVELLAFARAARARHIPAVMAWTSLPQPLPIHLVERDNQVGIAEAVDHLVDLGHRRIGFLAYDEKYAWVAEREQSFNVAMAARGLEPALKVAIPHRVLLEEDPALEGVAAGCTAVVCANDDLAVAMLKWARLHDRPVPGALSIVGFDDDVHLRQHELTTVHDDMERLGREAVRLLAHLLESGDGDMRLTLRLPARLVVRRTTGAPAGGGAG